MLPETSDDWKSFEANWVAKIGCIRALVCWLSDFHVEHHGNVNYKDSKGEHYYNVLYLLHRLIVSDLCFLYPHRLQCVAYCSSVVDRLEYVVDDDLVITAINF